MSISDADPANHVESSSSKATVSLTRERTCQRCGAFFKRKTAVSKAHKLCLTCRQSSRLNDQGRFAFVRRSMRLAYEINPIGFYLTVGPFCFFAGMTVLMFLTLIIQALSYGIASTGTSWSTLFFVPTMIVFGQALFFIGLYCAVWIVQSLWRILRRGV